MHKELYHVGGYAPEELEDSCLFHQGFKIERVMCPFQVTSLIDNPDIKAGCRYTVEKVAGSDERNLLYLVANKLYPHSFFRYTARTSIIISGLK